MEYLKRYIRTPRKLMAELKRLDLAPKQPKESNRGNKYPLSQERINGIVSSYLGDRGEGGASTDVDPFADDTSNTPEAQKAWLDAMVARGVAEKTLRI